MREIDNDARKETRLRHAKKEAREVKLQRGVHKRRERGNEAPRDEDARKPFPRAPTLDQQRARDFQDEIADEEDANAEAKNFLGKPQIASHPEFGEADVG